MNKRGGWYTILLIIILIASLTMLVVQNLPSITGHAIEGSTYSNVSITTYLAIQMSNNLSAGIDFGSVSALPVTDQNATKNWCSPTNGSCNVSSPNFNATLYYLNVSTDSNTAVDFCVGAPNPLTAGTDTIALGNETYAYTNISITNLTLPPQQDQIALSASYARSSVNISKGNSTYYRFYLDIPASQPAGSYSNLVYFRGVQTTQACGAGP